MAVEPLTEKQAAEGLRKLGEREAEKQEADLEEGKELAERLREIDVKLLDLEQRRTLLSTQFGIHQDLVYSGQDGTMTESDMRKHADELEAILKAKAELSAERAAVVELLPAADLDPTGSYGAVLAGVPDLSKATGAWLDQPEGDATLEDRLEAYGFNPEVDGVNPEFRPRTQAVKAEEREVPMGEPKPAERPTPIPGRTQAQIDANEAAANKALGIPNYILAARRPGDSIPGVPKNLLPTVDYAFEKLKVEPPPGYVVPEPRSISSIDPSRAEKAGLSSMVQSLEQECARLRYESEARRQALVRVTDDLRQALLALKEWQEVSDFEKCEGCDRPAELADSDGVALCTRCAGVEEQS